MKGKMMVNALIIFVLAAVVALSVYMIVANGIDSVTQNAIQSLID